MECLICAGILFACIIGPLITGAALNANDPEMLAARAAEEKAKQDAEQAYQDAQQAYQDSLAALRTNPANPELCQQALELGRSFARMDRPDKNETIFDEMALGNDIAAATAGGVRVQGTVETVMGQEPTKECQFCGGLTLKRFVKCKHCGSDFE